MISASSFSIGLKECLFVGKTKMGNSKGILIYPKEPILSIPHRNNLKKHPLLPIKNYHQRGNLPPDLSKNSPLLGAHQNLQTNRTLSLRPLRSIQPRTATNPLKTPLPLKWRRHQILQPIRQIITPIGTQKVNPVGHNPSQRQMTQKLIRDLAAPSFLRAFRSSRKSLPTKVFLDYYFSLKD